MTTPATPLEMVLITGMSGSGKSVALHALEDAGSSGATSALRRTTSKTNRCAKPNNLPASGQ